MLTSQGFPGGLVVKSLPADRGDMSLIPDLRGTHMPRSNQASAPQLSSLCSRAQKPQLLKPACPRPCVLQQEKHHNVKPMQQ